MIIDLVTFFVSERTPSNFKIIEFTAIIFVFRDIKLEAPRIIYRNSVIYLPFYNVLGLVGQ